ncbi:FAD-dependent monooxygenase [Amycolatopsis sp. CA-230715]|uniref:FAD-dependent monooxygenase n=1 Tax=Amycolatopsis sp. CA-230715 TaxID=2745196 RepID=UPI001C0201D6|nr:FAD-dependent monooxygenase [Amycolatopsis sp. CA-230715]QWF82393.1 Anhydrotetracycline monooxygenase [Amycolatopsis sp. CA-230715]
MVFDVVVAGAGPVGLVLAAELRLGGASVLVLERDPERADPLKQGSMGARGLNLPTVHAFHRRGVLPAVRSAALMWAGDEPPPASGAPAEPEESEESEEDIFLGAGFVGHFSGIPVRIDRVDWADPDLASNALGAGVIAQQDLLDILLARARELGADVRFDTPVTGFTCPEGDEEVRVEAGGSSVSARWLVGCDGGRSAVRKLAGFDFPGTATEFVGRVAIVDMEDASRLSTGDWVEGERGNYVVGGWQEGPSPRVHTVEYGGADLDRSAPVTAEEIQASLRRVSGTEVTVKKLHVGTRYTDNTRHAVTYRKGRVLIAGDAAHVHSPAGAQGLNLGLGDAMNLGWKLAAVARGFAPESLVDTYTAERHPVGAAVQRWCGAQSALGRRDERTVALRSVLEDLLDTPAGATYVVKRISGVNQRYDLPGDLPFVGALAPDLELADGSRLSDHARSGEAVVLGPVPAGEEWEGRVVSLVSRDYPEVGALVRPDGYVAWASASPSAAELTAALTKWLGTP